MTNQEIINAPSIAYYSGLNGLEIKAIEYGINDRVLCVCRVAGTAGKPRSRRTA